MNLVPPTNSELGSLRIEEVYFEYEGPKFFSAVSATGARYLSVMVEEDEDEDTEKYLYLGVSPSRFESIRSGSISLGRAFSSPEDGVLFEVVADYAAGKNLIQTVSPYQLNADLLPTTTARLQLPTESRPHFEPERLPAEAAATDRLLVALELEPAGALRTELSLRSLGRLSNYLQDTLDALGQEATGRPTTRGAIPADVVQATEMVFRENQAASFVVVLAESSDKEEEHSELLVKACSQLSELISHAQTGVDFRDLLAGYGPRARTKYRALMEELSDGDTGVDFFVAQPGQELVRAHLDRERLSETLDVIRQTGTEVKTEYIDSAFIMGANLRTRSFEIVDSSTGRKYSGYMEPRVRVQMAGLAIGPNHAYSATVLVQQKISNINDAVGNTYRLMSIGAVPTSSPMQVLQENMSFEDD